MSLTFRFVRRGAFIGAAAMTVAWLVFGFRWSQDWTAAWGKPKATQTQRLVQELAARDPQAAEDLKRLQARSDARAVEATLAAADRRGGLEEVRRIGAKAKSGAKPPALRLAELAVDSRLSIDREQRDAVLLAHGPAVEVLSGSEAGVDEYVDQLDRAAKDPSAWSLVRDDPVGLVVWMYVKERDLQDYYSREREWLSPVLAETVGDASALGNCLRVSKEYHPLVREAVNDLKLGRAGFELFLEYGPLLQRAVTTKRIPLEEALEIVFANRDIVAAKLKESSPAETAEWLAQLRANKPTVWKHARITPLALRLNDQAPDVAERLLEKFAADDVAALLFAEYERDVPVAARAVDRFGDLAIYVLNRHYDDARFRKLFSEPGVGVRLIPFVARYGSAGLDQAAANRGWIDKYFDSEGNSVDKEWWTKIPGGGLADVARNWATGKPNEWGELGWAALDVADAALLVASFGGSAVVSEVGEQTVKRAVVVETRQGAGRLAQGARAAAREAVAAGRAPSLLRRASTLTHSVVSTAGRTVLRAGERAAAAVTGAAASWSRLSPTLRRYTARALLGVGLYITLKERTLPMVAEKVGGAIEAVVKDPVRSLGQGLVDALSAIGFDASRWGSAVGIGLWVAVLGSLVIATWLLRPRRRQVVYVH